jgi:hypothetical protein
MLPGDAEEWERVHQGFENISSYGIMDGCFVPIVQPAHVADCNNNPMACLSGHD